ncbi:MAG: hypothetical protein M9932_05880 [Xanthobacteraceae bacterium]|nr:hypothetical protein [Xanthobacteraceae bacterium]
MADQNRDDRTDPAADDASAGQDNAAATSSGRHITVLPLSRDGHYWNTAGEGAAAGTGASAAGRSGKRRLTVMAAVFALAAVAGVVGGALASAGFGHLYKTKADPAAAQQVQALNATISKLHAEVAALKAGVERGAKADSAQLAKITDRVEKVEKAQAEPAAKLAKLGETVEKLRVAAATPAAPAPAAARESAKETARDITGSIPVPAAAPQRAAASEINRLPIVPGWRIRDVGNGGALIEGRGGLYEVYAGDPLPGVGRVDAIRKQDGRWVVVTSRGLIVAR